MKIIVLSIIFVAFCIAGIIYLHSRGQNYSSNVETFASLAASPSMTPPSSQNALFNANYPAPELTGITAWLNTDKPLTVSDLRGKVVLVDFWTNQCINCIRTLPNVTKWYDTYHKQGFVVIGVHTPELAYEYSVESIQRAINQYEIHYPIAQDNNYKTWTAYNNEYWPAEYLIDKHGIIRRTYFGEGEYTETEQAIKILLAKN